MDRNPKSTWERSGEAKESNARLYLKKPFNIILIVLLTLGLVMVIMAHEYHPIVTTLYSQDITFEVSPAENSSSAFSLFPNETTDVTFIMPTNGTVTYSIGGLSVIKVNPSPSNPSRTKTVYTLFAQGNATNGTGISFNEASLSLPVSTVITVYSTAGGTFNLTLRAATTYNSTISFNPTIAVTGLGLSTGSLILIATISGVKPEEL